MLRNKELYRSYRGNVERRSHGVSVWHTKKIY